MDVAVEIPIDTCLRFFNFDSIIRGHHVYQHIWTLAVGEKYGCVSEIESKQNKNAIAVVHEERVDWAHPYDGIETRKYVSKFSRVILGSISNR